MGQERMNVWVNHQSGSNPGAKVPRDVCWIRILLIAPVDLKILVVRAILPQ